MAALGCGRESKPTLERSGTPSASVRASTSVEAARTSFDDLSAPSPQARAEAARALAGRGDAAAREALLSALADDARDVLRFAAFGLGRSCTTRQAEISAALAVRAASLLASDAGTRGKLPDAKVLAAFADALGRCGGGDAERTLRAWLTFDGPEAEAAALGLGRFAARQRALEEPSSIALLDAAARTQARLSNALYAFTRFTLPEGPLRERLIEVGSRGLSLDPLTRAFAARALGRLGSAGVIPLAQALTAGAAAAGEQCEIARELGRTGPEGRAALGRELALRARDPKQLKLSDSPGPSDVVLAILESLGERSDLTRSALESLSRIDVPSEPRAARRAVEIRCSAARLLAGSGTLHADLRACDPDPEGVTGKLAMLAVLDRGKLRAGRDKRFLELATDADARVRQAAIRILPSHRELEDAAALVTAALRDSAPGVVAAAAEFLAKHPDRVPSSPSAEPPPLVLALTAALRAAEQRHNVETHGNLMDAAAALGLLSVTAHIERACAAANTTLRERAERALKTLGRATASCGTPASEPRSAAGRRAVKLVFDTEAGELVLELEPGEAPAAVQRIVELARSGFYSDVTVHRMVPGFVVQLGDPGGDGYGGAPLPPVPDELSPTPFEIGDVGLALSGPDTGNSQFFVTLGRFPHLDGEYPRLGKSSKGWERLRAGDRIRRVRVVELP